MKEENERKKKRWRKYDSAPCLVLSFFQYAIGWMS
jgi:hypothetical protein